MQPTKFLYEAAMKTPHIISPAGKDVAYEPIEPGPLEGECYLCGCHSTGYPRDKVIKDTFTDSNLAKAPWSDVVCDCCTWALSKRDLRNYSILSTEHGLTHPSRAELREILIHPPEPPFLICVAESGQKWLHFKSQINYSNDVFYVQFEDLGIWVKPKEIEELLYPIEELLKGFSKSEISTGRYYASRIWQFGAGNFDRYERMIDKRRQSSMFRLALFVAQKKEEEKCITDSTQTTKTLL